MDPRLQAHRERVVDAARRQPELVLLLLIGSRARGDAHERSDWDFAFLAREGFDLEGLRLALAAALETDAVDLVDLERAGGLLRFRAARDGLALLEREEGAFLRFQEQAAGFYCEVEPVLRRAYDDTLAALP